MAVSLGHVRLLRQQGQAQDELAAPPRPGAVGLDRAAVHVGQLLYERQADAQPALRAVQGALGLGEQVEHLGQQLRDDAHAVVPHPHDRLMVLRADRQPDVPAFGRILGRVIQEVQDHLRQPGEVAPDPHRPGGEVHLQVVAAGLD